MLSTFLLRSISGLSEETTDLGLHIMIIICCVFGILFVLTILSVVICKRKSPREQFLEDLEQIKYLNEQYEKQHKGKV